jgi:Flp pilus assembly pilin Flp
MLLNSLHKLTGDERGATAIEYYLIAGVISILIVTGATNAGIKLNANFFGPLANAFP